MAAAGTFVDLVVGMVKEQHIVVVDGIGGIGDMMSLLVTLCGMSIIIGGLCPCLIRTVFLMEQVTLFRNHFPSGEVLQYFVFLKTVAPHAATILAAIVRIGGEGLGSDSWSP
jgi:hypothetical protein